MSHHSLTIRTPAAWFACLDAPPGARQFLHLVADANVHRRGFKAHQRRLGEMFHRDRRTLARWSRLLQDRGWLRVIRRGKKLSNVYLLSRALWARLVGATRPVWRPARQEVLTQLGLTLRGYQTTVGAYVAACAARRGHGAPETRDP